jgi:DNA-binding beta-propeller fold protein YncE
MYNVFFMRYLLVLLIFGLVSCNNSLIENKEWPFLENEVAYIVCADNSINVIDLNLEKNPKSYFIRSPPNTYSHHINISNDKRYLSVARSGFDFMRGHDELHSFQGEGAGVVIDRLNPNSVLEFKIPFANHNAIVSNANNELWTATFSHSGKVFVFDLNSRSALKEIPVGPDPSELVFAKNNQLALIAAGESSFLTVIDKNKKEIIKEIKVDPFPTNVWNGFDQNTVFVENSNRRSLNIVDLNKLEVVDFIDFNFKPGFMIYNPKNSEIWICDKTNNEIAIYSKLDGIWNIKRRIKSEDDPHQIAFYSDFSRAIIINQKSNSAIIYNTENYTQVKKYFTGKNPNGIAINE